MLCKKWNHRKCKKLSKKTYNKSLNYICSRSCYNSQLPFHHVDEVDFFSALYGEGKFPSAQCKRDCTDYMACISCSVCNKWHHHICTNLTNKEFLSIYYFFVANFVKWVSYPFRILIIQHLLMMEFYAKIYLRQYWPINSKKRGKKLRKENDIPLQSIFGNQLLI